MIGFIFGVCHGKAAFELPTSGKFQVIILTCTLTVLPGCVRIKHVKSCHISSVHSQMIELRIMSVSPYERSCRIEYFPG